MNHYYVYAFLREDMTPYYIGKGSGNRSFVKRRTSSRPPLDSKRIVIIENNLSEDDAYTYEALLIKLFGRKDLGTGILNNLNAGGIGTREVSPQTREKMRQAKLGKPRSEISRKRQAATSKGHSVTNATKEKIRQHRIGYVWSETNKAKMSASHSGKTLTPEHRQKIGASLKGTRQLNVTCPHCNQVGGKSGMVRYHFDNCLYKGTNTIGK